MANKKEVQKIVDEAQDDFDLADMLTDGGEVDDSVKIYTNKRVGRELGGVEKIIERNELTGLPQYQFRSWGVMGKIFDLKRAMTKDNEKEMEGKIAALTLEAEALEATLEETAITLELRSIPPIIKNDASRAAKAELGLRGKIKEDNERFDEYLLEETAQLLKRMVTTIYTAKDDKTRKGLSLVNARALQGRVEETEFAKIHAKIVDLSYRRQIGEIAVTDPDF